MQFLRTVFTVLTVSVFVFTKPTPSAAAEKNGAQLERGKYLVTFGGCGDCHTPWTIGPKGPMPDNSRMLSGHPADMKLPKPPEPAGQWNWFGAASNSAFAGPWGISYARNLTPDKETGLGKWTEKDFIQAMRSGKNPHTGAPLLPPMPWPNLAQATDEDLKAVFAYLQSIPAIKNAVPKSEPATPDRPRAR